MVLRLDDLPLGFVNLSTREGQRGGSAALLAADSPAGHTSGSGGVRPRVPSARLRHHVREPLSLPHETPPPAMIGSGAMALDSVEAAEAGWEVLPTLLGRFSPGG